MSIGSIGSGAAFVVAASGAPPDPAAQKAQVNAQANLLQALRGVELPAQAAARMSDGQGVDLYV